VNDIDPSHEENGDDETFIDMHFLDRRLNLLKSSDVMHFESIHGTGEAVVCDGRCNAQYRVTDASVVGTKGKNIGDSFRKLRGVRQDVRHCGQEEEEIARVKCIDSYFFKNRASIDSG
jgi:hypothetical protein